MLKKIIAVIIILSGALLLSGLVYVMIFNGGDFNKLWEIFNRDNEAPGSGQQREKPENTETPEPGSEIKKIIIDNSRPPSKQAPEPGGEKAAGHTTKEELMRMAASFAERFGSYSNQSNFSNIIDLRIFMSSRMQGWTESYVSQHRMKESANDIYYGIITKAISQEIIEYDDHIGKASVLVNTRRREAVNSTNNTEKVFSQAITINFILEKEAWKIDSAVWEN